MGDDEKEAHGRSNPGLACRRHTHNEDLNSEDSAMID